ncbi:lichenan operon transcriptional antiterminator [Clostridium cavendishii DSM 21758]|uniref:Lichenan operon transcriptional antiterminator n=1 Tax=Clostridium cavendishii DSM 21758 TaxID=1121302 RepID=A0A1M6MHK5_9CLOT|nr:PRD domain-containing protein [Clostridium cavendishii]SHJ82790.1 lichenan operon transcriptional antiterminator [Clostridium cavendishii DSM 21758]
MEENKKLLLEYLKKKNDWVSSKQLSILLSVSTRTIRNYVKQLNTAFENQELIFSSSLGYKINLEYYNLIKSKKKEHENIETPQQRIDFIRNKLIIHPEGYSIYNLYTDLYVSEETILSDINVLQTFFKSFNLEVIKKDGEVLYLQGLERDKRKMIKYIINLESAEDFIPTEALSMFAMNLNEEQYKDFRNSILSIFNSNGLFINDYALNNVTLHLIVMVQRIAKVLNISEYVPIDKIKNTIEAKVAEEINIYLNKTYEINLNDSEIYYLTLTISSNTSKINYALINANNIHNFIEDKYIKITKEAVENAEKIFLLDIFNDEFLTKFTIHIRNLIIRANNNFYTKNPLTNKIKETYPLIYEMAVFIAMEIEKNADIQIKEDEIAFLALHIGAEIEKNNCFKNKITAVFVYADYYNLHTHAYDKIKHIFNDDLEIINATSINNFSLKEVNANLIISSVPIISDKHTTIIVNPFINDDDLNKIKSTINTIKKNNKQGNLKKYLEYFLSPILFKKNLYLYDKFDMIRCLTEEVITLGFTKPDFYKEVIQREKMSSTSFGNLVAVPHSMKQNAKKSFVSIVLNEKAIEWGEHLVNIVVLIGISPTDSSAFREIFDVLIEILSEPKNIQSLLKCNSFDEFFSTILNMI